jgi:hypothetical protein
LLHPAVCQVKQIVSCRFIFQLWRRPNPVCVDVQSTELPFRSIFSDTGPFLFHRFAPIAVPSATGGNDTMDMRVKLELLVPGMQHGEEADFRAEVSRIASDFKKCFGTATEQQTIDDLFVL